MKLYRKPAATDGGNYDFVIELSRLELKDLARYWALGLIEEEYRALHGIFDLKSAVLLRERFDQVIKVLGEDEVLSIIREIDKEIEADDPRVSPMYLRGTPSTGKSSVN